MDWLIGSPDHPPDQGPLVAFRVAHPPDQWKAAGATVAERLRDHRRLYLEHEGPLPASPDPRADPDRGRVLRLAAGRVTFDLWTPGRSVVGVDLQPARGGAALGLRVELRPLIVGQRYLLVAR